ncbi:MAG: hypothetical protein AAFY26_05715 [Cyanobacteria bacterium J06638_22]
MRSPDSIDGVVGDTDSAMAIALTTCVPLFNPFAVRGSPHEFALPNSRCFLDAPLHPVVAL